MSNYTQNYNLVKPQKSENYDIDKVTNQNMDIIDVALNGKVSKVNGKDLSTNDFTNGYKKKIDRMVEGSRGFSAYEIAVLNGFTGTEEEWLASLKGDKGDTGPASIGEEQIKSLFQELLLEKDKQKYPIGKIEFNTTGENPATYLGFGEWTSWGSGRVPVGVDKNDTDFNESEKTGGVKKVTLTLAQLPSHSHTFTGTKHTHSFSATTGNNSVGHTHGVNITTSEAGSHTHGIKLNATYNGDHIHESGATIPYGANDAVSGTLSNPVNSGGAHKHTVSGNTGGQSANHTHNVSGTTGETTQGGTIGNSGSGEAHNNLQPYITCYMWKRVA